MKSDKEIVEELIYFESFFTTEDGPKCNCGFFSLTHFHALLPNYLCGKELDLSTVKETVKTKCSSLCPCQESHFFNIEITPEGVTFVETDGEICDNRKINLPNFRK